MPAPLVIVTDIVDATTDPADPANKILLSWVFKILFVGDAAQEELGEVSLPNDVTKSQIRAAVNAAMIASVTAKGATLTAARILHVADIAG